MARAHLALEYLALGPKPIKTMQRKKEKEKSVKANQGKWKMIERDNNVA